MRSSSNVSKSYEGVNKRKCVRHPVLRQGQILTGRETIYCAIHDLSRDGARLEVGVAVPNEFELLVLGRPAPLRAEIKWRAGNQAGVAFREHLTDAEIDAIRLRQKITPRSR
jgi:PilZ domain